MARDFNRQVTELLVRSAILNGLTLLGKPSAEGVSMPKCHMGFGESGTLLIYATKSVATILDVSMRVRQLRNATRK